jgi:hypothetical protein
MYQPADICAYVVLGDREHSPGSSDCSYQQYYALLVHTLFSVLSLSHLFCPFSRLVYCHAASKEWSGADGYSPIEVGAAINLATTILLGRKKG